MRQTFSIVTLIAGVSAAPAYTHKANKGRPQGKLGNDKAFLNFASSFNKHYGNEDIFKARQLRYREASSFIREHNRKAEQSGDPTAVRLAINFTADMSQSEYEQFFGLNAPEESFGESEAVELAKGTSGQAPDGNINGWGRNGRGLEPVASVVDHAADGFMGPVKHIGTIDTQCWGAALPSAFASTIEGTLAKISGAPVEDFSTQHLMDCTYGWLSQELKQVNMELFGKLYNGGGCVPGFPESITSFVMEQGVIRTSEYGPYLEREDFCRHDPTQVVAKATGAGHVRGTVDDLKARVMLQPVTVVVDGRSNYFRYYQSGVLTQDQCSNLPSGHFVTIVGYSDDSGEIPPPPRPYEPALDCDDTEVNEWWQRCPDEEETRRLQAPSSDHPSSYWKIQNNWGPIWGDNGFALLEIKEGAGVCGINKRAFWIDMEYV